MPTQHSHRTQPWTTQQGVMGLLPRVPQQGILQLQDKTLPWFRMAAACCFPPLPRNINQANLLDFMSMMTLMQQRMDLGMPVPVIQSRPVDQTPTTRDDQTPPRRSRTPVRRSRTQSGVPEGWTSPEIPLVPGRLLDDRPPQNRRPGMLHQSTFPQLWTQKRK